MNPDELPILSNRLRNLDDEALADLEQRCQARLTGLQERGIQVGGLSEHFTQCMLTVLLTEDQEKLAREWHHLWLSDALDKAEAEIRKHLLTQGLAGPNGTASNREQRRRR